MMMYEYESPIKLIVDRMAEEISKHTDQNVWHAVQRVGVDVDKDELIRALNYDRGQYEKGFADAMKNAVPLDKLCEWLSDHAGRPMDCVGKLCGKCEFDGVGVGQEKCWENLIRKWMEEQDAAD